MSWPLSWQPAAAARCALGHRTLLRCIKIILQRSQTMSSRQYLGVDFTMEGMQHRSSGSPRWCTMSCRHHRLLSNPADLCCRASWGKQTLQSKIQRTMMSNCESFFLNLDPAEDTTHPSWWSCRAGGGREEITEFASLYVKVHGHLQHTVHADSNPAPSPRCLSAFLIKFL